MSSESIVYQGMRNMNKSITLPMDIAKVSTEMQYSQIDFLEQISLAYTQAYIHRYFSKPRSF